MHAGEHSAAYERQKNRLPGSERAMVRSWRRVPNAALTYVKGTEAHQVVNPASLSNKILLNEVHRKLRIIFGTVILSLVKSESSFLSIINTLTIFVKS